MRTGPPGIEANRLNFFSTVTPRSIWSIFPLTSRHLIHRNAYGGSLATKSLKMSGLITLTLFIPCSTREYAIGLKRRSNSYVLLLNAFVLAEFLKNVAKAWREANEEQRNKLARQLFDEIWVKDKQVIAVKPRPELKPFFQLSYEEWLKKFESENSTPPGVAI